MSRERLPSPETTMTGNFEATSQTWTYISGLCETILGGVDGKRISQKSWSPDEQPNALKTFGMTYGLDMVLARVGQTEPTPDTIYELTVSGRDFNAVFLFQPYKEKPVATLTGDQPKLVGPEYLPAARLDMLVEYLNTYLGDQNG